MKELMPSSNTGKVDNSIRDLIISINSVSDRIIRSIIISIGRLISVVILSSFLIIISITNKYAAYAVILGYIVVYVYSKIVDFINRLPPKQFEENNPNENAQPETKSDTSTV